MAIEGFSCTCFCYGQTGAQNEYGRFRLIEKGVAFETFKLETAVRKNESD